jgi:hypothetical protein
MPYNGVAVSHLFGVEQRLNDKLASGNPLLNQVAEAAFPQLAFKLRRGEPARRCLACNTYVNEMRSGAKLGCVVNGMTRGRVPLDALV